MGLFDRLKRKRKRDGLQQHDAPHGIFAHELGSNVEVNIVQSSRRHYPDAEYYQPYPGPVRQVAAPAQREQLRASVAAPDDPHPGERVDLPIAQSFRIQGPDFQSVSREQEPEAEKVQKDFVTDLRSALHSLTENWALCLPYVHQMDRKLISLVEDRMTYLTMMLSMLFGEPVWRIDNHTYALSVKIDHTDLILELDQQVKAHIRNRDAASQH